jgi:TRAP-type C4-dicarboxylate transport system permease small subunit
VEKIIESCFWLMKVAMALLLLVMVVLVFGNVVLRYGFNSGIMVSEELSRWLFIWMVFLGAVVGLRERAHLGIDSLVKALPPAGRKFCFGLSHLLMLYASGLLTEGSWKQMVLNSDTVAPATGLSVGIFYASGVFFGAASSLIILHQLYLLFAGKLSGDDLIAVRESEDVPHSPDPAPSK